MFWVRSVLRTCHMLRVQQSGAHARRVSQGSKTGCLVHARCAPAQVSFQAAHTLADVRVAAVTATADGQPVRYASKCVLLTDDYHVA